MDLHLDAEEQQLLINVLEERHRELLWELARTDHAAFKAQLRLQVAIMERVMEKLSVIELTVK